MIRLNERIKQLRNEAGMTQQEFANLLKMSRSAVIMYERGEREPNLETLTFIADYFDVDMDYLLGKTDHRNKLSWLKNLNESEDISIIDAIKGISPLETKKYRLLGNVACGEPIFANEETEVYIEAGADLKADFCLRAKGDSMIGARIYDGDIVFIRQQDTVEDGEIAAVLIEDEATLKRVYFDKEAGILSLFAENPQYKTLRYSGEQLNTIRILGKAVAFQSRL